MEPDRKLEPPALFSVRKLIFRIIIEVFSVLFSSLYSHISNYRGKRKDIPYKNKISNIFSDNICKGAIDQT